MPDAPTLAIVYQFGKVASTSIVEALNTVPNVEAHQCHFLGEDALRKSISTATDSHLSAYFRKHVVGQLFANLDLTYRVNRIRDGQDPGDLKIISLSREPMDWLRSCIQQDIEGYREEILAFSERHAPHGEAPTIVHGLTHILQCVGDFMDSKGGIDKVISAFRGPEKQTFFADDALADAEIVRRTLMLTLRPLLWFEDHFKTCFKLSLCDFARMEQFWLAERKPITFLILRYEDIDRCLVPALTAAKVELTTDLCRANSSQTKPFAAEIQAAFHTTEADTLKAHVLQSDYATFFGYQDQKARAAA